MIGCLGVALGTTVSPQRAAAQPRELTRYGPGAPEAKLMLYYSSTVAFSPLGVPFGAEPRVAMAAANGRPAARIEAAVEVSYLPRLSATQRMAGLDKPEATNLAPVFFRPRFATRLPGGVGVELSWIPPVRVFDVKANLVAGAVSRTFRLASVRVIPRASALGGRVEGPITCNRESTIDEGPALATYYALVCYGNDSRDFFEPRHISGELLVARGDGRARWQPYVSAGARAERTKFDVGVIRPDGSRDRDQPVLEVTTTRAYATAGTSWLGIQRARLAAEVYYAPGSVLTARGLVGVHVW